MRNSPPPMRMMSRPDIPIPKTVSSGAVSFIIQVKVNNRMMRNTNASASPIWRARLACAAGSRATMTEMKMTLSMPRTISSTLSATRAAHALGSSSRSIIRHPLVGKAYDDKIDRDDDKPVCDPWSGVEIVDERHRRQHPPQRKRDQRHDAETRDPERMEEFERHERQYRDNSNRRRRDP